MNGNTRKSCGKCLCCKKDIRYLDEYHECLNDAGFVTIVYGFGSRQHDMMFEPPYHAFICDDCGTKGLEDGSIIEETPKYVQIKKLKEMRVLANQCNPMLLQKIEQQLEDIEMMDYDTYYNVHIGPYVDEELQNAEE